MFCCFSRFFENFCVYNKHFITRVPRLYGLYPLVKVFLSLSRSAPSFEKHLTREYNPYALGNRVIIYTYLLITRYRIAIQCHINTSRSTPHFVSSHICYHPKTRIFLRFVSNSISFNTKYHHTQLYIPTTCKSPHIVSPQMSYLITPRILPDIVS